MTDNEETLEQYIKRELKASFDEVCIRETGMPFLFWEDEPELLPEKDRIPQPKAFVGTYTSFYKLAKENGWQYGKVWVVNNFENFEGLFGMELELKDVYYCRSILNIHNGLTLLSTIYQNFPRLVPRNFPE